MVELNLGTNQLTKIPDDVSSLASLEVDFTQKYDKYDKIFQAILNGKLNNQIDAFNFMQFLCLNHGCVIPLNFCCRC